MVEPVAESRWLCKGREGENESEEVSKRDRGLSREWVDG